MHAAHEKDPLLSFAENQLEKVRSAQEALAKGEDSFQSTSPTAIALSRAAKRLGAYKRGRPSTRNHH